MLALTLSAFSQTGVSLQQTFDWIDHTLQPSEDNNTVTHRPFERPYTKEWKTMGIDPYRTETISHFVHDSCRVELRVDAIENDMPLETGRAFHMIFEYTFNLKDLDAKSVRLVDSCAPIETPDGPSEPWNCQDIQGKFVQLGTRDAVPKIHMEVTTSARKSIFVLQQSRWQAKSTTWQGMCDDVERKGYAEEGAYCDFSNKKDAPKDVTSLRIGFSTPQYAQRFVKALSHAVELCGGKPSSF